MRAEWFFALLKELAHESFIDDRDVLRCSRVLVGDAPAAQNVLAHRLQVARAHVVPGRALIFAHIGNTVPFADDHLAPVIGERRIESEGGTLHSGDVG